jgi:hypothetical protein
LTHAALQAKVLERLVLMAGEQCEDWNAYISKTRLGASLWANLPVARDARVDCAVERSDFFDGLQTCHCWHLIVNHNDRHQVFSFFNLIKILLAAVNDSLAIGDEVAIVVQSEFKENDPQGLEVVVYVICADDAELLIQNKSPEQLGLSQEWLNGHGAFCMAIRQITHIYLGSGRICVIEVTFIKNLDVDPERKDSHLSWPREERHIAA